MICARRAVMLMSAAFVSLVMCGCNKESPATAPQFGRITVGVTTRVSQTKLEGMTFVVGIQPRGTSERIRADAGVYDEELPVGEYVVRLAGLPGQCRINGVPERRITVSARRTTAILFSVTCD